MRQNNRGGFDHLMYCSDLISYYLTLLFVFSLPFWGNVLSVVIVFWVLSLLAHTILTGKIKFNLNLELVLLLSLFLLYLSGILWSSDKVNALSVLETKSSFFVFPIVKALFSDFFKEKKVKILLAFLEGKLSDLD